MLVELLQALPIRLRKGSYDLAGTAGVEGTRGPAGAGGYFRAEPYPGLYSPQVETVLVRVETDVGLVGYGEAQAPVGPEAVASNAERLLTSVVVGRDPRDSGVLRHEKYRPLTSRGHTTGFALDAIAAVDIALWDIALWDIAGKAWGVPVHKLLGSAHRRMLPTYVSFGGSGSEEYAAGFPAVKLFRTSQPGLPELLGSRAAEP